MRLLDDSDDFFSRESHGACLSTIAHAFARLVSRLLIPSSYAVEELFPWGSHPALDPNYSSADLAVERDALRLNRLEKVGLIAPWSTGLNTLRSCWDASPPASAACGLPPK